MFQRKKIEILMLFILILISKISLSWKFSKKVALTSARLFGIILPFNESLEKKIKFLQTKPPRVAYPFQNFVQYDQYPLLTVKLKKN